MELLPPPQAQVAGVAERWKRSYCKDGVWSDVRRAFGTPAEVYEKLVVAKTPEEVDQATGNKTWVRHFCAECKEYQDLAFKIGDCDCGGVVICVPCAEKMLAFVRGVKAALGVQP